jgi:hypothetical protein
LVLVRIGSRPATGLYITLTLPMSKCPHNIVIFFGLLQGGHKKIGHLEVDIESAGLVSGSAHYNSACYNLLISS